MKSMFLFLLAFSCSLSASAAPEDKLMGLAKEGRSLDARVEVKRLAAVGVGQQTWKKVRALIVRHPEWGEDLLRFVWDKVGLESGFADESERNQVLEEADKALLAKNYEVAERGYRDAVNTTSLSDSGSPYLLLALARAQYGHRKFKDAVETYSMIRASFPKYRQVLFEKTWAAFRAGEVDVALGSIASQSSGFFSRYLEPEIYLIKIYLFKRLCRDNEAEQTLEEVKKFQSALTGGGYTYREWARSEPMTRALLNLVEGYESKGSPESDPSELSAIEREIRLIKSSLKKSFKINKERLLQEIDSVASFAVLAVTPGVDTGLKPIKKIRSREELLERGLEIWPSDDSEVWADEVGNHRFLGESKCFAKDDF